jgi:hypothetical protein
MNPVHILTSASLIFDSNKPKLNSSDNVYCKYHIFIEVPSVDSEIKEAVGRTDGQVVCP